MSSFTAPSEDSSPPTADEGVHTQTASVEPLPVSTRHQSSSHPSSEEHLVLWRHRIAALHTGKASPDVLAQLRQKSERKKLLQESLTRSALLERSIKVNTKSMARAFSSSPAGTIESSATIKPPIPRGGGGFGGFGSFGFGSSAPGGVPSPSLGAFGSPSTAADWASASATHNTTHHQLKKVLQEQRTIKDATDSATSLSRATAALEAVEKELDDVEALTGVVVTEETGIDALLLQLVEEPTDDVEIEAKFQLYENFLDGVSTVREETFLFWSENKSLFEGAVLAASERAMKELDTTEAMGLDDDTQGFSMSDSGSTQASSTGGFRGFYRSSTKPKWFVYHMTKKANDNSIKIGNTLGVLRGRLELLQKELEDCPFCLEDLKEHLESEIITLGCCHRACKECWINWQHIQGPSRAFCPLCRNVEFLEEIIVDA